MNSDYLRHATPADASAIAEIYEPSVHGSPVSFELTAPSASEIATRIRDLQEKFPWLVFERKGIVLGYAYASAWRTRAAYAWSVESSVYVRLGFQGQGIGRQLYGELLRLLETQGVVNVIAGITLPNEASVGLHEKMGFRKVAQFQDVGFKLGKWWDVAYWQLQLSKPAQPTPLRPTGN